MVKNINPSVRI